MGDFTLIHALQKLYPAYKEKVLHGRYITMSHLKSCSFYNNALFNREVAGFSVQNNPIELVRVGSGPVRILLWSQMHGNESTTTKAMADVFNFLAHSTPLSQSILSGCTLFVIPILNPDGACAYMRENALGVDLNRDIKNCSQPESMVLRQVFHKVQPHVCCNLHDQRSIYGVGVTPKSAALSFLAPLQDEKATLTKNRRKAMELIVAMNELLQSIIPGHVARYNDVFNIHCAGDFFQAQQVPTILFEAGHFQQDYNREVTREYVFYALMQCLHVLARNVADTYKYENYFAIPENNCTFFDVLIKQIPIHLFQPSMEGGDYIDMGIQYREELNNNKVMFFPFLEKKGDLEGYYGHQLFDYKKDINKILRHKWLLKCIFPPLMN